MLTGGCARALDANGARNGFKNKEIRWFGNEVWSPGGFRVPPVRSDVAAPVGGRRVCGWQQRGPDTPPSVGGRALTLCSSLFRRSGSPTRTLWCGSDPPRETCSPGLRTQTGDGSKAVARPSREFTGQTGGAANREKAGWALSREPGAGGAGLGSGRRTSWAGGHQAQHQPVRPIMETDPAPERTAKWKGDRNKP